LGGGPKIPTYITKILLRTSFAVGPSLDCFSRTAQNKQSNDVYNGDQVINWGLKYVLFLCIMSFSVSASRGFQNRGLEVAQMETLGVFE